MNYFMDHPKIEVAMVLLNFSDQQQTISVPFPQAGTYREMIDQDVRPAPFELVVTTADEAITIDVPSNYGYVFIKQA